eukprot:SAG22_NODE_32_length_27675_cov_12.130119_12_plen_91_part_00
MHAVATSARAPPDGLWFVTGNHEYLHGGSGLAWMQWWSARGVGVLYNNRTELPATAGRRGCAAAADRIDLAGVPDVSADTFSICACCFLF